MQAAVLLDMAEQHRVAEGPGDAVRLVQALADLAVLAHQQVEVADGGERPGPVRSGLGGARQRPQQPVPPLGQLPGAGPVPAQADRQRQGGPGAFGPVQGVVEGGPEVGLLAGQRPEPDQLLGAEEDRREAGGQLPVAVEVPGPQLLLLADGGQPFGAVLADGVEQPVAGP